MSAICSLPMAGLSELKPAQDAWWAGIAAAMRQNGIDDVPRELSWDVQREIVWQSPDLLFSQTCGYPLVLGLDKFVRLVATPVYDAPGCEGPRYSSAIVVRVNDAPRFLADLKGRTCAFNGTDSQSGYNVLRAMLADIADGVPFFGSLVETGAHFASMCAVANGEADVASIDCVVLAAVQRGDPKLFGQLRVLCFTASAPTLPYITSINTDDDKLERIRNALRAAISDPNLRAARDALLLKDIEVVERRAYDEIAAMETHAIEVGYPRLA